MILATVRMMIPPKNRGEALRFLRSRSEQCRDVPSCFSSHLYEDLQEKNIIMLEEVWEAQEDLDHHMRSDEYLNLLLLMEISLSQPEIRFDTISSSTGIETIERARSDARKIY